MRRLSYGKHWVVRWKVYLARTYLAMALVRSHSGQIDQGWYGASVDVGADSVPRTAMRCATKREILLAITFKNLACDFSM